MGGARLDRVLVDNFSGKAPQSERTPFLPSFKFRAYPRRNAANAVCRAWVYRTFPGLLGTVFPTYGLTAPQTRLKTETEKTTQLDIGAIFRQTYKRLGFCHVGHVNDFILFRYDFNDVYGISCLITSTPPSCELKSAYSYKLTDSWKTDASLAYSWGRNMEDGKPLPQMPPSKPVWDYPGKVVTGAVPGWYVWSVASIGWRLMKVMWWAKILTAAPVLPWFPPMPLTA